MHVKMTDNGKQQKSRNRAVFTCIIYLLIVVSIMIPVTLSSYVSTATGSSGTSIAKFSFNAAISEDANDPDTLRVGEVTLIPGTEAKIIFVVTSDTDVTMSYKLTVFSEGGLPISSMDLSCAVTQGTGITVSGLEAGLEYGGGVMAIGKNTHTYTLTVNVPDGIDSKYSGELQSFYVTVDAVQVD